MKYGKKELREEVYKRLRNHPNLLKDITAEKMTMVILANTYWEWDVEDVGRKLAHIDTPYEEECAWAGLEYFIGTCIAEFKLIKGE